MNPILAQDSRTDRIGIGVGPSFMYGDNTGVHSKFKFKVLPALWFFRKCAVWGHNAYISFQPKLKRLYPFPNKGLQWPRLGVLLLKSD